MFIQRLEAKKFIRRMEENDEELPYKILCVKRLHTHTLTEGCTHTPQTQCKWGECERERAKKRKREDIQKQSTETN